MVLTVLSVDIIAGIVEKYGEVRKLNLSSNGKYIIRPDLCILLDFNRFSPQVLKPWKT